jgi:hypothetical protein
MIEVAGYLRVSSGRVLRDVASQNVFNVSRLF